MGFFDENTINVKIIIFNKKDEVIKYASPNVFTMRMAHVTADKLKKAFKGDRYKILENPSKDELLRYGIKGS